MRRQLMERAQHRWIGQRWRLERARLPESPLIKPRQVVGSEDGSPPAEVVTPTRRPELAVKPQLIMRAAVHATPALSRKIMKPPVPAPWELQGRHAHR